MLSLSVLFNKCIVIKFCVFFRLNGSSKSMQTNMKCFICRVLGTPTEDTWPGVSQLPEFKVFTQFVRFTPRPLFHAKYIS